MHSVHFACISSTMMKHCPIEFSFSAGSCICGCLALMCLPLEWIISVIVAASIHELSHIFILRLLHIPIYQIKIEPTSTIIRTPPLLPIQEFFCAAAGPAGSLLCFLWIRRFPLFAIIALLQGLFNVLPIYPMDGGRMLYAFTMLHFPRYAAPICRATKYITSFIICAGCCYLHIRTLDLIYILACLYFLYQTLAKRSNIEYNIADF